jgi:hypothetical protein
VTDTHVVSALKQKRIEIASEIEDHRKKMRRAVIALDHAEASLRLFDPGIDMGQLGARKVAQVLYDTKGETGRIILETLRTATMPLSTAQVYEAVMKARGLSALPDTVAQLGSGSAIWPCRPPNRWPGATDGCPT